MIHRHARVFFTADVRKRQRDLTTQTNTGLRGMLAVDRLEDPERAKYIQKSLILNTEVVVNEQVRHLLPQLRNVIDHDYQVVEPSFYVYDEVF